MKDLPPTGSKPPSHRDDALAIVKRLREHGHIAYFAGGCVRDALLGLEPKDYDVATDAPPPRVRELFTNTQAVGAAFGVILVRHGRSVVEVATFRTDVSYEDGRRPTAVTFTTAEEDAKRRDFTINGLFFDPLENRVIDYVGGQEDLKNNVLRTIGDPDHRFSEDHLRLLRAVRFASRFDLTIDATTSAAMRAHAPHLKRISPERIAEELRLMLIPPTRVHAWTLLDQHGLLEIVFRFFHLPWEPPPPHPQTSGSRGVILFDRVAPGAAIDFGLALATGTVEYAAQRLPHLSEWPKILNHVSIREVTKALRQSLRISNEEVDTLEGTLYGLMILLDPNPHRVATLKRFLARPTAHLSRALLAALPSDVVDEQRRADLHDLEQTDYAPPPLLTGDDLTAAGWTPGPLFKRVLDAVYDAQLEDRITTKDEALRMAQELRGPP